MNKNEGFCQKDEGFNIPFSTYSVDFVTALRNYVMTKISEMSPELREETLSNEHVQQLLNELDPDRYKSLPMFKEDMSEEMNQAFKVFQRLMMAVYMLDPSVHQNKWVYTGEV